MVTRYTRDTRGAEAQIQRKLLRVLRLRRRLTFRVLAELFPEARWQTLFRALNRLRERRYVDLFPLEWDYEIVLLERRRKDSIVLSAD
jgi:hypothetical protein